MSNPSNSTPPAGSGTTALQGLRVLDFTQMMTGPFATMMLGDFGADVLKVEAPDGDPFRKSGETTLGGDSVFFLSVNRNKRGIVVDLKTAAGREIVRQLGSEADVIVENFRPGMAETLGLGYDMLREANPRLIYCSISGFGREGPDRNRPALDPTIQAMSGLMQMTGTAASGPLKTGFPFSDLVASLMAAVGILTALHARVQTGRGQRVDLSMMDTSIFSLVPRDIFFQATGESPPRMGNEHWDLVPNNTYKTSDDREIMVISINNKFWEILAKALGEGQMVSDARFSSKAARLVNRVALDDALAAAFRKKTLAEWDLILGAAGAIYGPVRTWAEVFEDPAVIRNLVRQIDHPSAGKLKVIANPLQFSDTPTAITRPPPRMGEHSPDILASDGSFKSPWQPRTGDA
jgi:crotonobetainyl-CoA:carnitine CoA-transferase CaiB-like acyl-CoA transferase